MKFEDVLPAFREGKQIKRECWAFPLQKDLGEFLLIPSDFNADDWKILEENLLPVKTKTVWQWAAWNPHALMFRVQDHLYTEQEASETFIGKYFKVSGPFEVSDL